MRGTGSMGGDTAEAPRSPGGHPADVPPPVGDRAARQRGLHAEGGCLLHTGKGRMGAGLPDQDAQL